MLACAPTSHHDSSDLLLQKRGEGSGSDAQAGAVARDSKKVSRSPKFLRIAAGGGNGAKPSAPSPRLTPGNETPKKAQMYVQFGVFVSSFLRHPSSSIAWSKAYSVFRAQ